MTDIPTLLVSPNSLATSVITARREDGYDDQWVARTRDGCYYDHDIFLIDLRNRIPDLKIIRDDCLGDIPDD